MEQSNFFKRMNALFVLILLSVFLSCGNFSGTSQNKNKQDTLKTQQIRINKIKDTCLVYFENENNLYTCCMRDLKTGDTIQLAHFNSSPMEVLWDTAKKTAYFFTSEGILNCRYDSIGGLERISEPLGKKIGLHEAWLDSINGNIRYEYLVYSDWFTKEQTELYKKLSSEVDSNLLAYGVKCLAYIIELDTAGKSKIITCEPGNTGAFTFDGFELINGDFRKEKKGIISGSNMMKSSLCRWHHLLQKLEYILPSSYSSYGIEKYNKETITGFIRINMNSTCDIIAAVSYGDTPHYVPPVLIYNKKNKTTKEMKDITNDQVAIFICGNYVLFADEYTNSDIIIYNWKTQQKIISLKNGTGGFIARL